MKRFLVLPVVFSVSAIAASIGTCKPGSLSGVIGNPCASGEKVFDNFHYAGDADSLRVNTDFRTLGIEFRFLLAPITGGGLFHGLPLTHETRVQAGIVPNVGPVIDPTVDVKDFDWSPTDEITSPRFFPPTNAILTTSISTEPGSMGAADSGLSSFETASVQAITEVPEPASLALMMSGLLCLGLLGGKWRWVTK